MLELLLLIVILIGVPVLVVSILAGMAAWVRENAERDLEAMAEAGERESPTDAVAEDGEDDSET
ncbi:hypothetical protein [Halovivax gelatinilyticus]|uniref:hypothetical protein n=1 Tax=Halovivax gelatinilyticus TaxID=2961597 RepID=UPI0020CA3223|nr:hypothetical protein [Halovivax gelatinilyticus]